MACVGLLRGCDDSDAAAAVVAPPEGAWQQERLLPMHVSVVWCVVAEVPQAEAVGLALVRAVQLLLRRCSTAAKPAASCPRELAGTAATAPAKSTLLVCYALTTSRHASVVCWQHRT